MKTNKAKNVVINGIWFKVVNKDLSYNNGNHTIWDVYAKPSQTKIDIYNYRRAKLQSITAMYGNSNTFSIYGKIRDEAGDLRNVYITAWNKYIEM